MANGQNWAMPQTIYPKPNVEVQNVDPHGPHAVNVSLGPTSFMPPGHKPTNDGFYSAFGHQSLDQPFGDVGGLPTRMYGEPVWPPLNEGPISSGANVNYVNLDKPLQNNAHAVYLRTKLWALVFDVDSSSYDSSQFFGIPRLPEFIASDFSDATTYDSNFNGTDSYVLLPIGSTSWCPNSEATHHVCQNASSLNASTPCSCNSSLLMDNGAPTRISSIGHTVLPMSNKLLHLSNVLCVSSIRKNLLSVSQFASDNNVFFEFHSSYCVIKDAQTQEVLMRGQFRDGLYHFTIGQPVSSATVPSIHNTEVLPRSVNNNVFDLWHKCLGHPSTTVVKDVLNKCNVVSTKKCLENVCIACQQGKAHKLPFVSSTTEYLDSFELIVSDLWGLTSVPCEVGLPGFILLSISLRRLSALFSSRKWFSLSSGYAFCSAVHLINRLPTPVLKGQSPYQALYRTKPTYDHLRVFGCCCFPYLRPFLSHKLEFRSQRCTFLGYSSQHKGFHYLTPDGKVIISRHVPHIWQSSTLSSTLNQSIPVDSHATCSTPQSGSLVRHLEAVLPRCLRLLFLFNRMVTRSKEGIFKPKVLHVEADDFEPRTVEDALAHPEWKLAIQAEFDALTANSTWTLVSLPPCRKARLVAKGCSQAPGCDFKEAFSPVVKPATIRVILSVSVSKGWKLRQQPRGYVQSGPNGERLLHLEFSLKDMGDLHYFLGVEVMRLSTGSLHLCQRKYIRDILDRSGLANAKSVNTPMISLSVLSKDDGELLSDPTEYKSLADFDDRHSTTGYCVFFGQTPISWSSKKQQVVSQSTAEAEYRSLAAAASDVTWLLSLLHESHLCSLDVPALWCDNSSAVAANPVLHSKFKHVKLDLFFVHEKVAAGLLVVGEVPACDQVADVLTKPLFVSSFGRVRNFLRVFPKEKMGEC
ncbi:hypothetical protein CXB51_014286 [Gossypium anomalum]|uniref:GAG-pre-integrase domain-containing protein n=1 Tax=Gossypium anomalum TaxID=47600 RepID=A0A8J5Z9Y2_9ROSI|nr:hypothetical protein CXB51_014286 [Gossypium anomalum]